MGGRYLFFCKQVASNLRSGCLGFEKVSNASELGSDFVPLRINTCRREFTINSQGWKCLCRALNKII